MQGSFRLWTTSSMSPDQRPELSSTGAAPPQWMTGLLQKLYDSEHSLCDTGRATRGRCLVGHLARGHARRDLLRQARPRQAEGRRRLARAGGAQSQSRPSGCVSRARSSRTPCRACSPKTTDAGLFAMEWLPPEQFPVWKAELRDGRIDPVFAAAVGERIAAIHAATARRDDMAARFANDAIFHPIRLEPYLLATAARHPRARRRSRRWSRRPRTPGSRWSTATSARRTSSLGPRGPVFLDAECAWYGDPAFDLAFCLNHMLLKGVWRPQWRRDYLACFTAWRALISITSTGSRARRSKRVPRRCCRGCSSRGSTASRRRSTSPAAPTRTPFVPLHANI